MFLLKAVVPVLRVLATAMFWAVGLVLLIALLPFFEGSGSYPWVARVIAFDTALMAGIRSVVPTVLGQLDFARAFLAMAVMFTGMGIDLGANQLAALTAKPGARRRAGRGKRLWHWLKKRRKAATQPAHPAQPKVDRRKGERTPGDKKSREELVRLMVEAKRQLDAMTRDVAFLALDVVESTNMKLGEDPAFIEHDFKEFKKMVEAEIAFGMLKSAWTPDGAMVCFDSPERAVRAAQGMLRRLPAFNLDSRMMGTPFRVRCGINAGRVQYDAATPMEAMSDNAIDVAGHMQKYAAPDTIFMATDLISKYKIKGSFVSADTEVDGYAVSVWRGPSADPPKAV
ncbi:MAG: guanylate cyclase [Gemmatimonadetes bacterium]|nr:guanylate cyclase [Gemmatimonadota bacterium]